jgi:hypothetical protein
MKLNRYTALLIMVTVAMKTVAMGEDFGQYMSVTTEYEQPAVTIQPKTSYTANTTPARTVKNRAILMAEFPHECQPAEAIKYNKPSYLTNFVNWLNSWFSSTPTSTQPLKTTESFEKANSQDEKYKRPLSAQAKKQYASETRSLKNELKAFGGIVIEQGWFGRTPGNIYQWKENIEKYTDAQIWEEAYNIGAITKAELAEQKILTSNKGPKFFKWHLSKTMYPQDPYTGEYMGVYLNRTNRKKRELKY